MLRCLWLTCFKDNLGCARSMEGSHHGQDNMGMIQLIYFYSSWWWHDGPYLPEPTSRLNIWILTWMNFSTIFNGLLTFFSNVALNLWVLIERVWVLIEPSFPKFACSGCSCCFFLLFLSLASEANKCGLNVKSWTSVVWWNIFILWKWCVSAATGDATSHVSDLTALFTGKQKS